MSYKIANWKKPNDYADRHYRRTGQENCLENIIYDIERYSAHAKRETYYSYTKSQDHYNKNYRREFSIG